MPFKSSPWVFTNAAERDTYGTAQGVRVGEICTVVSPSVVAYMWDGVIWSPVSAGAGAGEATLAWGAYVSGTGFYLDAGGDVDGGVSNSWVTDAIEPVTLAGDISELIISFEPTPASQVWALFVDDVEQATATMGTAADADKTYVLTLDSVVSVTKGQGAGVQLKTGSAPNSEVAVRARIAGT